MFREGRRHPDPLHQGRKDHVGPLVNQLLDGRPALLADVLELRALDEVVEGGEGLRVPGQVVPAGEDPAAAAGRR